MKTNIDEVTKYLAKIPKMYEKLRLQQEYKRKQKETNKKKDVIDIFDLIIL